MEDDWKWYTVLLNISWQHVGCCHEGELIVQVSGSSEGHAISIATDAVVSLSRAVIDDASAKELDP